MKDFIHRWFPPELVKLVRQLSGQAVTWKGRYSSWNDALAVSTGYNSSNILDKVKAAMLKVKRGEAAFERDSILFDQIQYSWPILAALMWVAAHEDGRLHVLDFGGSLGSSYFQNRKFFADLPEVSWSVVEQPHFVICGREHIEDACLKFYMTIEECLSVRKPNVVLLSSVLPYLPDWLSFLDTILSKKIPTILIDRTPFTLDESERLTVQTVPKKVYKASYPCWFLNQKQFLELFTTCGYQVVEEFEAIDKANIPSTHRGFIFTYTDPSS